jgi:PAS domain S-box-containing protein
MQDFGTDAVTLCERERLDIACRAAGIGIWQWDLRTGRFEYSDVARAICGFPSAGEVTFDMVRDITHPDDVAWMKAKTEDALNPGSSERALYHYRIRKADTGDVRWLAAYGEARFAEVDGEAQAVLFLGTMQDITEQKEAEEALVHNEARLRLALEVARMAVWELDQATDEVSTSPELNRLYGFPEDATPTSDEFRSRYAPGERERLEGLGAEARARGEDRLQAMIRTILPDGTERHLLMRAQLAPGATPGRGKVIGALLDMTDEKRREDRLAQINQELRHRLQNLVTLAGALASQSFSREGTRPEELQDYLSRLRALSQATSLMFRGEAESVEVTDLLRGVLAPYQRGDSGPVTLSGPEIRIPGRHVTPLAMAVHELATNAVKHGALSVPGGRVSVRWALDASGSPLRLDWEEVGGPAVNEPPETGFGLKLLRKTLFNAPDGVEIDFRPPGLTCHIYLAEVRDA